MTTEKDTDPEEKQICARNLVIVSTLSFLVVGAAIIVCGIFANKSGWLDILDDAQISWLKASVYYGSIVLGSLSIIIGISGCLGATYRKRGFLVFYNVFLVISLILFGLIIGAAWFAYDYSESWIIQDYPADVAEITVAKTFNTAYCYTEASRICDDANIDQVANVSNLDFQNYTEFIPDIANGGLDALCSDSNLALLNSSQIPNDVVTSIENACDEALSICSKFDKYDVYDPAASAFLAQQCPQGHTSDAVVWCSNLIIHDEDQDPYTGPYGVCRSPFLNFWNDTSKWVGVVLIVLFVLLLAVVISTCILARRRSTVDNSKPTRRELRIFNDSDDDEEQRKRPTFATAY